MKVIRRYKNRKLYDTETSQYITLKDVAQYVQNDVYFLVVDNASKKDLTTNTLLQAFSSYAKIDETTLRDLIVSYAGGGI